MEAGEREEEAGRAKEAGNDAYRKLFLETAVHHYTRGALLDPGDISFLTNRAAAYLLMGKVSSSPPPPPPRALAPIDPPRRSARARLTIDLNRFEQYQECVKDCDEAVERGRELNADHKLVAKALLRKASALLELAGCAGDYAPVIRALQQSLAEHYSEDTREAG
jgi:hypothetical protein